MTKKNLNKLKKDLKTELNKIHDKNLYGCELFTELFFMCEKSRQSAEYLDLTFIEDELYNSLEKELQKIICYLQ